MRKKEIDSIHDNLHEILIELERIASDNNLKYNLAYGTALGAVREQGFIDWDTDLDIMVTIDEHERFCTILKAEMKEKFVVYSREKNGDYYRLFNRIGLKNVPHYKLHIDIFPMVGAPKSKLGKYVFGKGSYLIHLLNSFKNESVKERKFNGNKELSTKRIIVQLVLLPVPNKLVGYLYNKLKTAFPITESRSVYSISGPNPVTGFIPKNWIVDSEYKKFEGLELPVPKEWDKYLTRIYGDYMTPRKKNYYR